MSFIREFETLKKRYEISPGQKGKMGNFSPADLQRGRERVEQAGLLFVLGLHLGRFGSCDICSQLGVLGGAASGSLFPPHIADETVP